MPLARSADEMCARCGSADTWVHEKDEGSGTKLQYQCEFCCHEWTEWTR